MSQVKNVRLRRKPRLKKTNALAAAALVLGEIGTPKIKFNFQDVRHTRAYSRHRE